MVSHGKIETPRRSPAALLDVVHFRSSVGHALVRQVGHREHPFANARLDIRELALERGDLVAEPATLGEQRRGVLSFALRSADLFRERIALRLKSLRAHLDRLAL